MLINRNLLAILAAGFLISLCAPASASWVAVKAHQERLATATHSLAPNGRVE